MNELSDFDLVKLCKANNPKAIETLYKRYLPFINKKFFKFRKTFASTLIEQGDFQNDCYFALVKALDYVNFQKISKPDSWKFLGAFMWYIDGYVWETIRQFNRKEVQNTPLYISTAEGDEIVVTDLSPDLLAGEDFIETCYEKDVLDRFYKSLDEFEIVVLKKRSQIREKGKPTQISEIAKDLGTNFNKIQSTCKTLENKFKLALVY